MWPDAAHPAYGTPRPRGATWGVERGAGREKEKKQRTLCDSARSGKVINKGTQTRRVCTPNTEQVGPHRTAGGQCPFETRYFWVLPLPK